MVWMRQQTARTTSTHFLVPKYVGYKGKKAATPLTAAMEKVASSRNCLVSDKERK